MRPELCYLEVYNEFGEYKFSLMLEESAELLSYTESRVCIKDDYFVKMYDELGSQRGIIAL